jgi:hypothetical protein
MADGDWFDGGGRGSAVDVPSLLDSAGGTAIWDLVAAGALVGLGLTRDRGALGVTITVDGRWRREYFRDADDLQLWMAEAVPAVRDALERLAASSEPGKRARGRRAL